MLADHLENVKRVYWRAVFHKASWYLKRMLMLALAPWMVWFILLWASVVDNWAAGSPGHNGGLTGLIQDMGLHPHVAYALFLWTTAVGVFLAVFPSVAWLLLRMTSTLVDVPGRKIKKSGWVVNLMQKTAPQRDAFARFQNDHPNMTSALSLGLLLMVIAVPTTLLVAPHPSSSPRHHGIVLPPPPDDLAGLRQAVRYGHVLLRMPVGKPSHGLQGRPRPWIPDTRTVYGKAVVTQSGPGTYRVRMVP